MSSAYVFANVGRAGLGNLMLPWARAELFARQHSLPMLATQWTQPKIGPILRGERDRRFYVGIFKPDGYVRGLSRWLALWRRPRVGENDLPVDLKFPGKTIIEFKGLKGWFDPLLPHREYLKQKVFGMLHDVHRQAIDRASLPPVHIALHVRRGDKQLLPFGQPFPAGSTIHTPSDEWYRNAVRSLRKHATRDVPAIIYSDGRPEELKSLLAEPNVSLSDQSNAAIVDMLLMGRARALVGCAESSFSGWAGFFGQYPCVWYPGKPMKLSCERSDLEIETDLTGDIADARASVIREFLAE
jgi:hypothetical protein